MKKRTKNTIIIVAIILIIFAIIFVVYQKFQAEPMNANTTGENILEDANTGLENMLNDILNEVDEEENSEDNSIEETEESEKTTTNNSENKNQANDKKQTEDDNRMTSKESKAIELVKKQWEEEWGDTDDVSFNVSVQSDGKYGVTVYDTTTTKSIQFYIVDVDTGIIKER